MRLLELRLLRFGPFDDLSLPLTQAHAGCAMHILYGSNEAGKSTARRAIGDLLFGIPERSGDAHRHGYQRLLIGATVAHSSGARLSFWRRKGRKQTLLDAGQRPLPDEALQDYLGALSRAQYLQLYGLDHQRLVDGGQLLLDSDGELGESLFAAGAGFGELRRLRESLAAEAAELYKATGSRPHLNQALSRYQQARREAGAHSLPPQRWHQTNEHYRAARDRAERLLQAQQQAATEWHRLQRLARAAPLLVNRRACLDERQSLGAVPELAADAGQRRRRLLDRLDALDARCRLLDEQRGRQLSALAEPQPAAVLLGRLDEVQALGEELASFRRALDQRPQRQAAAAAVRGQIDALAAELGRPPGQALSALQSLLPDIASRQRLRELIRLDTELATALENDRLELDRLERRAAALDTSGDDGEAAGRLELLNERLLAARRAEAFETRHQQLVAACAEQHRALDQGLAALGLWHGDGDGLARLPVPLTVTVERFERQFRQLDEQRAQLAPRHDDARERLQRVERDLAELKRGDELPSETALQAARARRDRSLENLWLPCGGEEARAAYRQLVREADRLADRLRGEAGRVAAHAGLAAERARLRQQLLGLDAEIEGLTRRRRELDAAWQACWQGCGLQALPPAEMRLWLQRRDRLCADTRGLREIELQREALERRIDQAGAALRAALAAGAETPADETCAPEQGEEAPLAVCIARAERQAQTLSREVERRQRLRQERRALASERAARERRWRERQRQRRDWREHWGAAVRPLGLDATASAAQAEAVLDALDRLGSRLNEARELALELERLERHCQDIERRLRELAALAGIDVDPQRPLEALRRLLACAEQADREHRAREQLGRQLDELDAQAAALAAERAEYDAQLSRLQREAGADSLEALVEIERRVAAAAELDRRLEQIDARLADLGGAPGELQRELEQIEFDALPGAVETAEIELQRCRREYGEAQVRVGELKNQIAGMDGSDAAARAEAEAQAALAEVKTYGEDYLRLRLCELLLARAIEDYRAANQNPLLKRAGELFRRMTLGAFDGIGVGFAGDDRPQLRALRQGGDNDAGVAVAGLSEGSRDQLFLALRLASIERHAAAAEAPPLIVDDLLINFDDGRAEATLAVLAELAQRVQVLFFTHHGHLRELAVRAAPAARWTDLPPPRNGAGGAR